MDNVKIRLRDQHRKLWLWLAQDPGSAKTDWPGWQTEEVRSLVRQFPRIKRVRCFACYMGDTDSCEEACPIRSWLPEDPDTFYECEAESGDCDFSLLPTLYNNWKLTRNNQTRTTFALHIAFAWK